MTDIIKKLFGRKGRAAIYGLVAAGLAVAVVLGFLEPASETIILEQVTKLLGIAGSILALFNLTPPDAIIEEAD